MTDPVTFDLIDDDSSSLERARTTPVEIARDPSGASYLVAFEDSDDVHEVDLHRRPDGWHGDCWTLDDSVGKRRGVLSVSTTTGAKSGSDTRHARRCILPSGE